MANRRVLITYFDIRQQRTETIEAMILSEDVESIIDFVKGEERNLTSSYIQSITTKRGKVIYNV